MAVVLLVCAKEGCREYSGDLEGVEEVTQWRELWGSDQSTIQQHDQQTVRTTAEGATIPIAHGSFDNDIEVVRQTLLRILGTQRLRAPVTNLQGY